MGGPGSPLCRAAVRARLHVDSRGSLGDVHHRHLRAAVLDHRCADAAHTGSRVAETAREVHATGESAPRAKPAALLAVTWLGHSSVVIELDGARLLTDPVLGRRVGPLRRVAPPV